MKKQLLLFAALLCSVLAGAKSVKLNPGLWEVDGAKFAVWHWQGDGDGQWSNFMTKSGEVYETTISDASNKVIFVRLSSDASSPDWSKKWNQTDNLDYQDGVFNISDWNSGSWGTSSGGSAGDNGGGSGNSGGNTGGSGSLEESGADHFFALMGSIGGDWNIQEQKDEYMFDERGRWSGKLKSHPAKNNISYVVILDEQGNQYKTKGWQGEDAKKVTLYWANGFEGSNVWQLPAEQTLYMIMRSCTFKGAIEVELVDKTTYDNYSIDWGTSSTGAAGAEDNTGEVGNDNQDSNVDGLNDVVDVDITIRKGTILSEENLTIYTVAGENVTLLNGNLQGGLYIVKMNNGVRRVFVP